MRYWNIWKKESNPHIGLGNNDDDLSSQNKAFLFVFVFIINDKHMAEGTCDMSHRKVVQVLSDLKTPFSGHFLLWRPTISIPSAPVKKNK